MSEQAKFTPGPWKALSGGPYVVKSNSDPNGSCGDSVVCVTANTASHVRFAADVGSLEDKANARLIAAAPELLSALQTAYAAIGELTAQLSRVKDMVPIDDPIQNVAAYDVTDIDAAVQAAIRKATGN